MERLERLRERRASLSELRDLFRAMRGIAASKMQEAVQALEGVRRYARTLDQAISAFDAPLADKRGTGRSTDLRGRTARILFCSEHGFVGAMNDNLMDWARTHWKPEDALIIVGRRGGTLAMEQGLEPADVFEMTTHLKGVLQLSRQLARRIEPFDVVSVTFVSSHRGSEQTIEEHDVYPISSTRSGSMTDTPKVESAPPLFDPLTQLPPDVLAERLADEFLFARLARAATEALASEHAARLRVMEAADRNAGDKLATLVREEQQSRQAAITSELLDVIAGATALSGN